MILIVQRQSGLRSLPLELAVHDQTLTTTLVDGRFPGRLAGGHETIAQEQALHFGDA
jgi:hypothetical protein